MFWLGLAEWPDIPLQRAEAHRLFLLPQNEVEVAEVLRSGTSWWGEDLRKTRERDVQQRHLKRDGNECRRTRDTNSFSHWANVVFTHWKCVDNALWCMYEKKCAFACVWVSIMSTLSVALCCWLSAKLCKKNKLRQDWTCSQTLWLLVTTLSLSLLSRTAPVAWLLSRLLETRVPGCLTHRSDHLSSCKLCWCHLCQFEDHEDELHQDVDDQLDEEDGWCCSSAKYSSQFVLSNSRWSILLCKRFLSLTVIKELIILFSPYENFLIALSLPGTLVSVIEVAPVYCRQHCVGKVYAYFFLVAVAAHRGRYWIVQRDPSIEPKHPTNYGQAEIACKRHHFAICPRLTWILARLLQRPEKRHELCGDAIAMNSVHICHLL